MKEKMRVGNITKNLNIKLASLLLSFLIILSGAALAVNTTHTSYGAVNGGDTSNHWKFYVVSRPSEVLTGDLIGSGPYGFMAYVESLPTNWAVGEDSVAIIWKEDNPVAISHKGYYAVMNEGLMSSTPQQYADCTLREIPTPIATANTGVDVSWLLPVQDQYENPPTDTGGTGNTPASNIIGYNVYRSTNGTTFTKINNSLVTGTTYSDTAANSTPAPVNNTLYYYAIEIVYKGGVVAGSGTPILSANSNQVTYPAAPVTPISITTTSLPAGTVGVAYSQTIAYTGGNGTNIWSIIGSLPAGLTLDNSTGLIHGIPGAQGTSNFTVQVISNGTTATKALSIAVYSQLSITSTSPLDPATVGIPYSKQLSATGGDGTYTWSKTSGSLPAGLQLYSNGIISGTPTSGTTSSFTVEVRSAGQTASRAFSITVGTEPIPLEITTTSLPSGIKGADYNQTLHANGGNGSYSWSLVSGSLPGGISLNPSSGSISGTPTVNGTFPFTVKVTDSALHEDTRALSLTINLAPAAKAFISLPTNTIKANEQVTVTINYSDANNNIINTEQMTWSAPQGKAQVYDLSSLVTGTGIDISGNTTITVVPAVLDHIVILPANVTIEQGQSATFTAKGYDVYGNERTGDTFGFASDLGDSSTVTANIKAGDYVMSAYKDGKSDLANIRVNSKYDSLIVKVESGKVKLSAKDALGSEVALPANASVAYDITGKTDGNAVASDGTIVEGSKEGDFTVTATVTIGSQTLTGTAMVSVNKSGPAIQAKIDNQDLANNIAISSKPKIEINLTDGNGVKAVRIVIDGSEMTGFSLRAQNAASSSVSFTPDTSLGSGSHTLLIEAEDSLGTKSSITALGLKVYADLEMQGKPMNYPNPFKPSAGSTTINYRLTKDAEIKLMIYDFTGRLVYTQIFAAGSNGGRVNENEPTWDGKSFSGVFAGNGVYVYFITAGGKSIGSGEISIYE